ncbi:MAG TPA: hypothetical protein VHG88_02145 [Burkholderiales bacterium]|nr:hypothetical protein [Burkholderiales bacterium]
MDIVEGEARRQLLEDLVPMPEAALLAHLSAFGMDQTISRLHRDDMAHTLARLLTVYAVSQDRRVIRRLAAEDLQGGSFTEAGRVIRFEDGREPITGLAVTRVALKAAVAALKDAKAT